MEQLQHSDITHCERTGHPPSLVAGKPLLCGTCKDVIQTGEYYGECDGRIICSDCIEDEWKELTAQEKFIALGYDSKFNG